MYVPSAVPVTVCAGDSPLSRSNLQSCDFDAHRRRIRNFPSDPKILLLEPFYPPEAAWGSVKVEQGYLPPLGTISVYRWLKEQGYSVDFQDTQFGDVTEERLRDLLRRNNYSLVGLPLFTPTANHVFDTAKIIRSVLPDAVIVYGGVHATNLSVESLEESPECDFVIRREGEYTIVELLESLKRHETDFSAIEGITWRRDGATLINTSRGAEAAPAHPQAGGRGAQDPQV
ncbi:MAG: cobalamin B12-binding domain-containing protein [Elusimicrobia bacterium]|nr:cobalamin B12-binding domain-containing protein [Elusimicrobiota bacterium]